MANGHRATTLSLTDDDAFDVAASSMLGRRGEFLRMLVTAIITGLVAGGAAYYGLRERLAILETKVEFTQKTLERVESTVDHIRGAKP